MANDLLAAVADDAAGALTWQGDRVLVVPVEAICEIQRGAEVQGDRFSRELVAGAGFATGAALARSLRRAQRDQALAASACALATHAGLGRFRLAAFDPAARLLEVEVDGSPFAAAFAPAEDASCPFLRGVVTAIAEAIFGMGVAGEEVACAAAGADRCRFRAKSVEVADEGGWTW